MDNTKEKFQQLSHSIIDAATDHFAAERDRKEAQKNNCYNMQLARYVHIVAQDIQEELFTAMWENQYAFLPPISNPSIIRPDKYKIVGNNIIFYFRLPAHSISSRTHLGILKSDINQDIYRCQQNLLWDYGYDIANLLHPYLMNGLYVLGVKSYDTHICLAVASNYLP